MSPPAPKSWLPPIRRPSGPRSGSWCPVRARCPTACGSWPRAGRARQSSRRQGPSPSSASASACRCCSSAARKATPRASDCCPAACRASGSRISRFRIWAGTRCCSGGATRCGRELPTAAGSTSCTATSRRRHIVDLNGAIAGRPKNEKVIRDMIVAVGEQVPIQLGGGIRDLDAIESYLDAGVSFVVIGTAAVKNPGFLSDACYAFPGHVIAGLDAKDGKVAVEGWSKMTGHDVVDLAKKFEEYGVEALIYTDIGRDGMLTGVNIDATLKLAQAIKTPIIASGGLNSLKDVQAVCSQLAPEGIIGAIAGRALYEGKLDLKKAQATADKALAKD